MAWFRNWRRARYLARHVLPEPVWSATVADLPILQRLTAAEQQRLRDLATLLLREKPINGAGDFAPTPEEKVRIMALAALPILYLDLDWYDNWHEMVLYPETFVHDHEWMDENGLLHYERRELDGESWEQGPIVLAWHEVEASGRGSGFNLVVHEIAHKIDMLAGDANGLPPLHRHMSVAAWSAAFEAAFEDMVRREEAGEETPLDPYGASAPEEFFAVACEAWFETPEELRAAYPAVYEQLRLFFRPDALLA